MAEQALPVALADAGDGHVWEVHRKKIIPHTKG